MLDDAADRVPEPDEQTTFARPPALAHIERVMFLPPSAFGARTTADALVLQSIAEHQHPRLFKKRFCLRRATCPS